MPNAGRLLLDTNAVIALFSREPPIDRLVGAAAADNDVWIAAAARQHSLVLLTRDVHFAAVDGLQRQSW